MPGEGRIGPLEVWLPRAGYRFSTPQRLTVAEEDRLGGYEGEERFEVSLRHGAGECDLAGFHLLGFARPLPERWLRKRRQYAACESRQRLWKAEDFLDRLIFEERHDEALDVAYLLFGISISAGETAFRAIERDVRVVGEVEDALELSERCFEWRQENQCLPAMGLSRLYMARAYSDLGRHEEAAQAAVEAFSIHPNIETASVGARLLFSVGGEDVALPGVRASIVHTVVRLAQAPV